MSGRNDARPIVIKRKKVVAGGGHHGGAWKVAYADFVTAMMAFFLMLWLLGSTTDDQRKGLADYFSPAIPMQRASAGGVDMFGGAGLGPGQIVHDSDALGTALRDSPRSGEEEAVLPSLEEVEAELLARGADDPSVAMALRHVVTRVTDEGLVVEMSDLEESPLFEPDTATPMPVLLILAEVLADVFAMVANPVAIEAHSRAYAMVAREPLVWELTASRAQNLRMLLVEQGFATERTHRVTGHADRRRVARNPLSVRNNRLEVILLRQIR